MGGKRKETVSSKWSSGEYKHDLETKGKADLTNRSG